MVLSTLTTTILKTLYGFEVQDMHDPFVVNAEEVLGSFSAAATPGAFMVDVFPIRALSSCIHRRNMHSVFLNLFQ